MLPEREDMIIFALHLEEIGEANGWDQPPVLGITYGLDDGLASMPLPAQPVDFAVNGDVVGALMFIGEKMLKERRRLPSEFADKVAGVWFISEGWMHRDPGKWTGGRISELPGDQRSEVRTCAMLDCAGRVYFVNRIKGEKPEVEVADPDSATFTTSGNVVDALRRILLAIGKGMSPGMIDVEKVGQAGA